MNYGFVGRLKGRVKDHTSFRPSDGDRTFYGMTVETIGLTVKVKCDHSVEAVHPTGEDCDIHVTLEDKKGLALRYAGPAAAADGRRAA